jgi:hypothetical protein
MDILLSIFLTLLAIITILGLSILFNALVMLTFDWGIHLTFLERRFKGNLSPIYKLESDYNIDSITNYSEDKNYHITRYDLTYYKDTESITFFLIPLGGFFKTYGYQRIKPKYGNYTELKINEGYLTGNLKDIWTNNHESYLNDEKVKLSKKNKTNNLVEGYNKEFNENFK